MSYLDIFGMELEKILSYLKSASWNLSIAKIGAKIKILKFKAKSI